jgi:signal transduction histidine kinase
MFMRFRNAPLRTRAAKQGAMRPMSASPAGPVPIPKGHNELLPSGIVSPNLSPVTSARQKLRQIAVNRLPNAIKYTQTGSISLTRAGVDQSNWKIVVQDSGIEIPQKRWSSFLQSFHKVEHSAHIQGVGIGLTITRQLVTPLSSNIQKSRTDARTLVNLPCSNETHRAASLPSLQDRQ